MKLLVDRLTTTPTEFSHCADAAWWRAAVPAQPGPPLEILEPFAFRFRAHCIGSDLYLEGTAEGAIELECSRCLARYRHALGERFCLVLEPAGERSPADPEAAAALAKDGVCLGDEIEAGWFRGDEIHLGAFFRELISSALPVKPLCDENCAGLCPNCGVELGVNPCDCRQSKPGSPFEVLRALRDGSTGGSS